MEMNMQPSVKEISTVKIPPLTIKDDRKVRVGMMTPAFPAVRAEPENVRDDHKVRVGMMTPAFPPRAR